MKSKMAAPEKVKMKKKSDNQIRNQLYFQQSNVNLYQEWRFPLMS